MLLFLSLSLQPAFISPPKGIQVYLAFLFQDWLHWRNLLLYGPHTGGVGKKNVFPQDSHAILPAPVAACENNNKLYLIPSFVFSLILKSLDGQASEGSCIAPLQCPARLLFHQPPSPLEMFSWFLPQGGIRNRESAQNREFYFPCCNS